MRRTGSLRLTSEPPEGLPHLAATWAVSYERLLIDQQDDGSRWRGSTVWKLSHPVTSSWETVIEEGRDWLAQWAEQRAGFFVVMEELNHREGPVWACYSSRVEANDPALWPGRWAMENWVPHGMPGFCTEITLGIWGPLK